VTALGEGRLQVAVKRWPSMRWCAFSASSAPRTVAVESLVVRAAPEPGRVQVETLVLRTGRRDEREHECDTA
jgi:hypothetical protein